MAEGALFTVLEMLKLLIANTLTTTFELIRMFGQLLDELGFVGAVGGTAGLVIAGVVAFLVTFFLGRFILGVGKSLVILIMVVLILLGVLFASLFI